MWRGRYIARRVGQTEPLIVDSFAMRRDGERIVIESVQRLGGQRETEQRVVSEFTGDWRPVSVLAQLPRGTATSVVFQERTVTVTTSNGGQVHESREPITQPRTLLLLQHVLHWPNLVVQWATHSGADKVETLPRGYIAVGPECPGQGVVRRTLKTVIAGAPMEEVVMDLNADGLVPRFLARHAGLEVTLEECSPC